MFCVSLVPNYTPQHFKNRTYSAQNTHFHLTTHFDILLPLVPLSWAGGREVTSESMILPSSPSSETLSMTVSNDAIKAYVHISDP